MRRELLLLPGGVVVRAGVLPAARFQAELLGHAEYLEQKAEQLPAEHPQRAVLRNAARSLSLEIEHVPFQRGVS